MTPEQDDVLCTLLAARTLIDVEGWCQNSCASDGNGPVNLGSDEAKCFCAFGAMYRVTDGRKPFYNAEAAMEQTIGACVPSWNDAPGRTKAQVLKAFDKAIARLEKEAP